MLASFSLIGQDSIAPITLEEVSIIDLREETREVFKSVDLKKHESLSAGADLSNALQSEFPVYFKNYSYGGISTIDFRGSGSERSQVYWNGMPINSPSLGQFDFSLYPAFFISNANVRFGAASLLDGSGGVGGSIQLNQSESFEGKEIKVLGGIGSFANYETALSARFAWNKWQSDTRFLYNTGKNDYPFKNTYKQGHPTEYRNHNEVRQVALQQFLSYELNKNNSFDFKLYYTDLDRNIPTPISSNQEGSNQIDRLGMFQFAYNLKGKSNSYFKIRTGYQIQETGFRDLGILSTNQLHALNTKLDYGYLFKKGWDLSTSLRWDHNDFYSDGVNSIQEDNYSWVLNMNKTFMSSLHASLGLRVEGRSDQLTYPMPYLGLSYALPGQWGRVKGSLGRVYRLPTINERFWRPGGDPDIKAEEGWNSELAYVNEAAELTYGITAFYGRVSDWILWYPDPLSSFWSAQNIWEVETKGVEVSLKWKKKISDDLRISTGAMYNYNASIILDDAYNEQQLKGKRLILQPAHMMSIPLDLNYRTFFFEFKYNFTGERFSDRTNDTSLDPIHLLDLAAAKYFLKDKLEARFYLNNLLNINYETVPGRPLPGINAKLQIAWKIL